MTEFAPGTKVRIVSVPFVNGYEGVIGTVVGMHGRFAKDTYLVHMVDPETGVENEFHAVVEAYEEPDPAKYMIDFDRMLLISLGFFDTEAAAWAWIEKNVTKEDFNPRWPSTFEVYKGLYQPIPIYPNGDERLENHLYGRYSGGLR